MDWTLEQLTSFAASARHGSFSEAARTLGRAQSVISTHVSTLEAELGLELFDRRGRLPVLTEAGRDLLAEAQEVLRRCQRFEARAVAQYKGDTGLLGIAVGDGVPFHAMSRTLRELAEQHPFIRVRLHLCPNAEAWQRVENGDVNFALVYKSDGPGPVNAEGSWVASVSQVIVAPWDHPLAGTKGVSPPELALHRQIVVGGTGPASRRHVMSTDTWETNDIMIALHLAWNGLGWTVLPEPLLEVFQGSPPPSLQPLIPPHPVILDTGDWELPPANLMLLWNFRYHRREITDWLRRSLTENFHKLELNDPAADKGRKKRRRPH